LLDLRARPEPRILLDTPTDELAKHAVNITTPTMLTGSGQAEVVRPGGVSISWMASLLYEALHPLRRGRLRDDPVKASASSAPRFARSRRGGFHRNPELVQQPAGATPICRC
jgi:hypothetical protein